MRELFNKHELLRLLGAIFGALMFAVGMNFFVVPAGLYSGGILGFCQLLRTFMDEYLNIKMPNFDIAGILYYIINIPLLIMAFKDMGKIFFAKTLICLTAMALFMSIIPIPEQQLLTNDVLTSSLMGAIVSGLGCGLELMCGASGGGMDIVGLCLVKKKGDLSVGKIGLLVNLLVYCLAFFIRDFTVVIYSIIYAGVYSVALDKIHTQNINVEVIIITRIDPTEMQHEIMTSLVRGITKWNSTGVYTSEGSQVLFIVLSKYEINKLKHIVHKYDPDAFMVEKEGVRVLGNYLRKL